MTSISNSGFVKPRFAASLAASILACGAVLLALIDAATRFLSAGPALAGTAIVAFALVAAGVSVCAASRLHRPTFGKANSVTMLRAALVSLLVGYVAIEPSLGVLWSAVALASSALLLDGVDGSIARRFGEEADFGARFDMETDAALIMILSVLVWRYDRAGAWILLAGLMRYAFVLGGRVWPRLRRPLPPSRRRQTVCVAQVVVLLACLTPAVPVALVPAIAAAGLAALTGSFVIDVMRLISADRSPATGRLTA